MDLILMRRGLVGFYTAVVAKWWLEDVVFLFLLLWGPIVVEVEIDRGGFGRTWR